MPQEKPVVRFTPVQQNATWLHRIHLEVRLRSESFVPSRRPANYVPLCRPQTHHESQLPSQRYKYTRQLPAKVNPIIPQDVSTYLQADNRSTDFPKSFLELNAPMQRPPALGNPIFGYSCHPIPSATVVEAARETASPATRAKLAELQQMIDDERKKRKAAEAKLSSLSPR
jgi:hypothetical protein